MSDSRDRIKGNLERVAGQIDAAAERSGRSGGDVLLVAVTKTVGIEEINILRELGVTDFGENRIHVAQPKIDIIGRETVNWHMIGSIQRRKTGDVADLFAFVDSIDRVEVAEALNKRCEPLGKTMDVLIEVNVSGEESKHGFTGDNIAEALDKMNEFNNLRIKGLMTMAPFVADPELARPFFAKLRELTDKFGLREASMGMTNDFEVAIEEGATQVRIGSALFA